ncbi:PhzF family phenazine biosynthesis protein [Gemmatimonadota bacterium]
MDIPLYQVDAFTSELFRGNPAAVCLLDSWPEDAVMQAIAAENNLSETAFLLPAGDDHELRWFTPTTEVALCGHATLASAFVLFEHLDWPGESISFHTRMSGTLNVSRWNGLLELDFPTAPVVSIPPPEGLGEALGVDSEEVYSAGEDVMVVLPDEQQVRDLQPDMVALSDIECRGVIVTAPGESVDFVSRFFCPRVGIAEDPVTGSAHCALTPYWSERLGKTDLNARQVSARGGELFCTAAGERVTIAGRAVLYSVGMIRI